MGLNKMGLNKMGLNRSGKTLVVILSAIAVVIAIGSIFCVRIITQLASQPVNQLAAIKINDSLIKVEQAITPAAQYQGLSGRQSLGADCGMIFVWPDSESRTFVMRNMNFPLDIIFIEQNKIIKIAANLEPEGSSPINKYSSDQPADLVLEVNAGYAARHNFQVGDPVSFQP